MRAIFRQIKAAFSLFLVLHVSLGLVGVLAQESTPVASPSSVEENRAIAFYPEETGFGTFVTFVLKPGEYAEASIVLGNSGNVDQELRTYAVPVDSGLNGGFVLTSYGSEPDEQTSWLDYPEQRFEFDPGEGVTIPLKVSVPKDATPGEYVTSLAAEQADAFAVEGTDMSSQRVRWSVPVLIDVQGSATVNFEVGPAELEWYEGSLYGMIDIANIGNKTINPVGEVRLLDSDDMVIGVSAVGLQPVYSGTSTAFTFGFESPLKSEVYGLELVLKDEESGVKVEWSVSEVIPKQDPNASNQTSDQMQFSVATLLPIGDDSPPAMLAFAGLIENPSQAVDSARVSIVTYQDGVEVDRYPIMQAVTIQTGETPIEARYSLPGGFTDGTYTFEVTIEIGSGQTQTVLVTQDIDFEVAVGD